MDNCIEQYIAAVAGGKGNGTPRAYRVKLRLMARLLGEDEPHLVTPYHIEQLTPQMRTEGYSEWTIKSTMVTVRAFWAWWSAHTGAPNPAACLHIREPPPPQPKAIRDADFVRLLAAAQAQEDAWLAARDTAILLVLRDSGCRLSGLLGMRLRNVDCGAGWFDTREKGRTLRYYISTVTCTALVRVMTLRASLPGPPDRLWVSAWGDPLTNWGLYRMLDRLREDSGVRGRINPHSFRHAFARDALQSRQADLSQVSRMLHHSSIAVTALYYARWDDAELRDAHARASPVRNLGSVVELSPDTIAVSGDKR